MRVVAALLILFASVQAFGQETDVPEIRNGFRDIRLGMSMDDAKQALADDPNFQFRGDPDVSFSPSSGRPILETAGLVFIDRAILQFNEDQLYALTLILNTSRLDYFGVFTEFSERYGDPVRLDPSQSVWESETVRLLLERPLTVKYIDVATFEAIVEAGSAGQSLESMTREQFLGDL